MNTTLLKRYPLLVLFFLLTFSMIVSITSCSQKADDLITIEQNAVTDLEVFANDLTKNPIYLEFLYDKIDAATELSIVLALKSKESADDVRNYGNSIATGREVYDNEKALALLNLSPEEEENLLAAATKLMESSARLNEFLAKQHVSKTNHNQVFEIISSSKTNQTLLYNNLLKFEKSYLLTARRSERQCNRRFKWCMAGDFISTGLIAVLGCTSSIAGGPVAVTYCLGADIAWFSGFSSICASRWFSCRGLNNPAGGA